MLEMDLSMNSCVFEGQVRDVQSHNKINNYYRNDLHEFLTPLDPERRHIAVRDGHTKGTGEWLLRSAEFREWYAGTGARVLCCTGDPGIGKTYLACRVIERSRQDGDSVTCHVYCDYVDRKRQTARNILGALLLRIIMYMESKSDLVKELQTRCQHRMSLDVPETTTFLCRSVTSGRFRSVRICLDALDELDPEELDRLLHSFAQLCDIPAFYIFLTGRRNAGVESSINRMLADATSITYLPISTIKTCPDMQLFLIQKLKDDRYSDLLDCDMRETVFERLAGAESTFLLASLNVKMLLNQKTKSERREAIDANALDLDDAYERMLERIKEQDPVYGMRILQWVLFSIRPLSLEELRYALAIRPGVKDLDPTTDLPPPSIIDVTLGLITVETQEFPYSYGGQCVDNMVRFIHFTFKEHLLAKSSIYFPTGHSLLAEATLAHLSHVAIRDDGQRYVTPTDHSPFYRYVFMNWGRHVREGKNEALIQGVCDFLRSTTFRKIPRIALTFEVFNGIGSSYSSPLRIAAHFGLSDVLTRLLPRSPGERADLILTDLHRGSSLLSHPAREGHLETLQLLKEHVDLIPGIESNLKPFAPAAEHGRLEVVEFLLEQEVIRANLAYIGPLALSYAAQNGHLDIVRLLLSQKDIDINGNYGYPGPPLISAALSGHTDIIELLLEREDIDVNSIGDGTTALHCAAKGKIEDVALLLEREDIDLHATNNAGKTVLMSAAESWNHGSCAEVVRLLLDEGVDPNLVDAHGRTAFFYATRAGNRDVVRLFLEREDTDIGLTDKHSRTALSYAKGRVAQLLLEREETDIGHVDNYGRTALSCAAERGNIEVVELLLARDPSMRWTDNNGRTVLSYAAGSPNRPHEASEIMKMFLQRTSINVNSVDNHGRSALSYAAEQHNIEAVELLLQQKNIDVGLADNHGRTAISYAAAEANSGDSEVAALRLLLEREEIDIGAVDNCGRTPLSYAAEAGNMAVVQLLLAQNDWDPSVNLTDNSGRTVLSYAAAPRCSHWGKRVIGIFLQWGNIDVNSADNQGRTALSYAAASEFMTAEGVGLLLEQKGINVGMVDYNGRTALSYAAERGNAAVIRLLRAHESTDIGLADNCGRSALSYAAGSHGGTHATQLLLAQEDANVEINLTDRDGRTALSYAAEKGNTGAVELLLERNDIDVGLRDNDGLTALSYAEGKRHGLIVKLLRDWEKANISNESTSSSLSSITGEHDIGIVREILDERWRIWRLEQGYEEWDDWLHN